MARGLTDRQRQVFDVVCDAIRSEGRPPTVREIADHFGFASPKAASDHLTALERKGYLTRPSGKARDIEVREELDPRGIPLLGRIDARKPLSALENLAGSLNPIALFGATPKTVAVRVKGNHLRDEGILDGDYVVVENGEAVEDGCIAVVRMNKEPTVRRVSIQANDVKLGDGREAITVEKSSLIGPVKGIVRRV